VFKKLHCLIVLPLSQTSKQDKQKKKQKISHENKCALYDTCQTWHDDRGGLSLFGPITFSDLMTTGIVLPPWAVENL